MLLENVHARMMRRLTRRLSTAYSTVSLRLRSHGSGCCPKLSQRRFEFVAVWVQIALVTGWPVAGSVGWICNGALLLA